MVIKHLSNSTLISMHQDIDVCLKADDDKPSKDKKFGVRIHPDWRQTSDAIEAELNLRGIPFIPIRW